MHRQSGEVSARSGGLRHRVAARCAGVVQVAQDRGSASSEGWCKFMQDGSATPRLAMSSEWLRANCLFKWPAEARVGNGKIKSGGNIGSKYLAPKKPVEMRMRNLAHLDEKTADSFLPG